MCIKPCEKGFEIVNIENRQCEPFESLKCVSCRFVRREKEIAVAQCEASEGEALRYKQRMEYQDREVKELQEALNAEREKMQVRDGRMNTDVRGTSEAHQ